MDHVRKEWGMSVDENARMARAWRDRAARSRRRAERALARADRFDEVAGYYEWKARQEFDEAMPSPSFMFGDELLDALRSATKREVSP